MKILKNAGVVLMVALLVSSCKNEVQPEVKTVDVAVAQKDVAQALNPNATYAKVEFSIDGKCCLRKFNNESIKRAIKEVKRTTNLKLFVVYILLKREKEIKEKSIK